MTDSAPMIVNGRFTTQQLTGVQRYASEICQRLVECEERLVVLAPSQPLEESAVEVPTCSVGRLTGHAWEQIELPLYARGASLLWSPCNIGPASVARQIVTLHDVFSIRNPEFVSRTFRLWYSLLIPHLVRTVRHVITVSDHSRAAILEALPLEESDVTVIAEGVDERFVPAPPQEVQRLRATYGLPADFLLTLGSLEPRKNLERVVRSWSSLPRGKRLPLVIAGGIGNRRVFGNYDLDALLGEPDLKLLGYIPDSDLPALYSAATAFVYVALEEGFGLPPLEALACETAVLTSATSAMEENCRGLATLIDPLSEEAIRAGLEEVVENGPTLAQRSSHADEVRRRFNWDDATAATLEVLKRYA